VQFGLESVEGGGAFSVDEKLEKTLHLPAVEVVNALGEAFPVLLFKLFQYCVHCDFRVLGEQESFFFFASCFSEDCEEAN